MDLTQQLVNTHVTSLHFGFSLTGCLVTMVDLMPLLCGHLCSYLLMGNATMPILHFYIFSTVESVGAVEYTDSLGKCLGFDAKQSGGEVTVMLEFWGMQSTPSLTSIPRSTLAQSGSI